jgi:hypothetical protein
MQKPFINIPEPCKENWNGMQANEEGRYCMLCEKTVTDFTSYTNEEIIAYMRQHSGSKICGRVKAEQVKNTEQPKRLSSFSIQKIAAALMVYLGFTSTSCKTPEKTNQASTPLSIDNSERIMGDMALIDTPQILTREADSNNYILGGLAVPIDSMKKVK